MKKITIKRYEDPGHSWFAVKRKTLAELGILSKITAFSYQNGETVYLEEDSDAGIFFEAVLKKLGMREDKSNYREIFNATFEIVSKYHRKSCVRNYVSFKNEENL